MNGNRFGLASCKLYKIYCSRRILVDQNSHISLFVTRRASLQSSSDEPTSYLTRKSMQYEEFEFGLLPLEFLIHEVGQYASAT